MVRVISEKLFSPPRSRHSSGETVDKELAARAVEALSSLNSRRLELSDYESSSDSHWDSEGDGGESSTSKDLVVGEERQGGSADILRKRKERRRERNKLSAQLYRVRRKEQTAKQQTVLQTLQEENTRLKSTVSNLEDQLQKVRHSLRQQRGYLPSFSLASSIVPTSSPSATASTTTQADTGLSVPGGGGAGKAVLFGQVCGKLGGEAVRPAMDNDQSHQQQVAPVVDNFLFSKSLAATPSHPTGAVHDPPTVTPPPFSFPPSPVMGASRHNFSTPAPFLTNPLPTISEKPDGHFLGHHHHQHHPKPQQQQQQQHADFNANANSTFALNNSNANVINTNANVFGMYQNNNRIMNNNNPRFQTVSVNGGEGGASADMSPQCGPFKMCRV